MKHNEWMQRSYHAIQQWKRCQKEAVKLFEHTYQYLTHDNSSVQDRAVSEMLYIQKTEEIKVLQKALITAFEQRIKIQQNLLMTIQHRLSQQKDISWQVSIFNALNNAVDYSPAEPVALFFEYPYDDVRRIVEYLHHQAYIRSQMSPDAFQNESAIVLLLHEKMANAWDRWKTVSVVDVGKNEVTERCIFEMTDEQLQKL